MAPRDRPTVVDMVTKGQRCLEERKEDLKANRRMDEKKKRNEATPTPGAALHITR